MIDNPTIGTSSTLALAAKKPGQTRLRAVLCNNSDEDMYICPGETAIDTAGIPLKANGGSYTDRPDRTGYIYQGIYTAICASGGKVLSVTELP